MSAATPTVETAQREMTERADCNDVQCAKYADCTSLNGGASERVLQRTERRFWGFVDQRNGFARPGCWIWTGSLTSRGYGYFACPGQQWLAHRFSYTNVYGPIPDGHFVCHRCDNPRCVRPSHLFIGTAQDNVQDMIAKGRAGWQRKKAS